MAEVKITFVGTGDAANSGGRAHQAIWIHSQNVNFLVDCGATTLYRLQLLGMNPDLLDGVIFTHFHGDHIGGIVHLDLALTLDYQRKRSLVYGGPQGIKKRIDELCKMFYGGFYPNCQFERKELEFIANQKQNILENVEIYPIAMDHSPESLGYRIKIGDTLIAITGDTRWTKNVIALAEDADLLICECFSFTPTPSIPHTSYEEIMEYKQELKSKKIVLTHAGPMLLANRDRLDIELMDDGKEILLSK